MNGRARFMHAARKRTYENPAGFQILFFRFSGLFANRATDRARFRSVSRTTGVYVGCAARPGVVPHARSGGGSDVRKCPKLSDFAECVFTPQAEVARRPGLATGANDCTARTGTFGGGRCRKMHGNARFRPKQNTVYL
jgi:hypothetical protein